MAGTPEEDILRTARAQDALALALADPEREDPWAALEHELEALASHGPFADGPWDSGVLVAEW